MLNTHEVWTSVGLVRYLVFFVLDLPTRRVEIAGIAPVPNGVWMQQVGRNLIDEGSGFLREKRFLINGATGHDVATQGRG